MPFYGGCHKKIFEIYAEKRDSTILGTFCQVGADFVFNGRCDKPFVTAVVVAAGNSTRMSCYVSKQLIPLLGAPAISYTLKAFENAHTIDEVVIVCRKVDMSELKAIVSEYGFSKVKAFTVGGSERSDSVKNGVEAASDCATHFAIHDGARALITAHDIDKVVSEAFVCGAATLGAPGNIISTPDRASLMAVQTPQVFERNIYLKALENAKGKGFTDDCGMVEEIGVYPKIIMGDHHNLKLTTQADIPMAETILKQRQESEV